MEFTTWLEKQNLDEGLWNLVKNVAKQFGPEMPEEKKSRLARDAKSKADHAAWVAKQKAKHGPNWKEPEPFHYNPAAGDWGED